MRKSTNKLTKHELDFASSKIYPQTKQSVMRKMHILLGNVGSMIEQNPSIYQLANGGNIKLSKGDNYKGMPYIVCDYPQIKGREFGVVMRTLFWWGHYFSCYFIIETKQLNRQDCIAVIQSLKKTKVLVSEDLWEQDLASSAYIKCKHITSKQLELILNERQYVKLATKISLNQINELPERATSFFEHLTQLLGIKKGAD